MTTRAAREHAMALYALREGYRGMKRSCRITKAMEAERLARYPRMSFGAVAVPGWRYYPATDSVERVHAPVQAVHAKSVHP